MLPGIRAVITATAVAIALLAASFGVVATFRVAQDSRAGSLQADLAQRGRALASAPAAEAAAPLQATPIAMIEAREIPEPAVSVVAVTVVALPLGELAEAPLASPADEPGAPTVAAREEPLPPAEPPMGGPLELPVQVAAVHPQSESPAARQASQRLKNAQKAAAAKKARAARLARERKLAAARRAAQARRARQSAGQSSGGSFNNNSFGSFGNNSFGGVGNTTPRSQ